jgi:hypothetical protein
MINNGGHNVPLSSECRSHIPANLRHLVFHRQIL